MAGLLGHQQLLSPLSFSNPLLVPPLSRRPTTTKSSSITIPRKPFLSFLSKPPKPYVLHFPQVPPPHPTNPRPSPFHSPLPPPPPPPPQPQHHGGGNNNGDKGKGGWRWWNPFEPDGWFSSSSSFLPPYLFSLEWADGREVFSPFRFLTDLQALLFLLSCLLSCLPLLPIPSPAFARTDPSSLWEVKGGKWTRLVPNPPSDGDSSFVVVVDNGKSSSFSGMESCWQQCKDLFLRLMLPEGYPHSVSSDYIEYSLWRAVQGIASQISGVLSTQSLLYAVGLGKGAIPTAAAVNWVLKDGIGYLSKILLSKFGRHFDVNPKGWRLFADLLENAAYGMEIVTPAFPQFFILIGAAAGAGRSAAALIQAATRSCFYAGFAVRRNFAEVIAKGEAQGMVSKFLGIMLGIAMANYIGSSTPLALASSSAITGIHMYCNLKSYQSIHLRTLNPYRACLVFSEYLLTGQVPLIKEVNDEEPLFPGLPFVNISTHRGPSQVLSMEAKDAAAEICRRLQLGSKLSEVIYSKDDASALFHLFRNESYLITEDVGRFCVILKEGSSPQDMLKSLFHVNYLYWLERNMGLESSSIADDCRLGGRLQISLDYVQREFSHIKHDGLQIGWLTDDGLIARPLPNRIRPCYADSVKTC